MNLLIPFGAAGSIFLFLVALKHLLGVAADRRKAVAGADYSTRAENMFSTWEAWDARFRSGRLGRWLENQLDLAGLPYSPLTTLVAGLAITMFFTWSIWTFLAELLAIFGLVAGVLIVRGYLRRAQLRRQAAVVAQLPELARILANASFAGLSLPTALSVAGREMSEPARTEINRIATRVKFGAPLEVALQEFRERIPSREAGVLISTLVVSSRSGGALVTALRGIAESLEQRKETRRQVATALSGPVATANMLVVLAIGILFLLNAMQPGTVDAMTRSPIGWLALGVSGVLFAVGYLAIMRLARVEP